MSVAVRHLVRLGPVAPTWAYRSGHYSDVPAPDEVMLPAEREGLTMVEWPTRTANSGAIVVRPEGRLNMVAAPELREQLHALIRAGNIRLVVDLSAVDSIDSSGLGALISGLKTARQSGGDLRLASPGEQPAAVLQLTNLNRVLKSVDSADSAFDESP